MSFIYEKVQNICNQLRLIANQTLLQLTNLEYLGPVPYKAGNTPPQDGWLPWLPGMQVHGRDQHYWFRTTFTTPAPKPHLSYYVSCTTGYEGQWDATNPQGLIYLNGKMAQGCDTNHTEIYLEPNTDYVLHNYFYVGLIETWVPLEMRLYALDERSEQLYYDLQVALDACLLHHPNSDTYIALLSVLEQTVNLLDLRDPGSGAYYDSVEAATSFIRSELYGKLCTTEGKPTVDCIGHTHIDVEWEWTRTQTREKIQRSFSTAAALMKQYPEYKFMLSQPELYRYLREEAPEKYEELKELVRQGRWEPEGAMWLEADCNLTSGESFIRQILQGKKFFRDEFDVDSKILFLPDVFGYSSALPQILKKSGVRHFVTSKISWNETNCLPVDCFLWEGMDGTEIFTNFITTQDFQGYEARTGTTYCGCMTPSDIKGTWNKFQQKEYTTHAMTTYGFGDGGGGPTRKMLEYQRRMAKGLPGLPVTRPCTLLEHLDLTRKEFDEGCRRTGRTPKWVGELYLEFHRGTYTSQARTKRGNRKSEQLLQKSEALSYADLFFGGSYDAEGLYAAWRKVLHNQFHDIIPGSSIHEVYEGTDRDYAEIGSYCKNLLDAKLASLAENVAADRGLLVYNSLGFARNGMVTADGKTAELLTPVPACGWQVAEDLCTETAVTLDGLTAENRFYRLVLDRAGRVTSLWDKQADREVLLAPGNELQAFEDFPRRWDNWEISDYYKEKMWILDDDAEIVPITDGSRAGFRVTRAYLHSVITQHIWLYSLSRRIDFETHLDWHEHHQILKAAFPLDVHTDEAVYEIQFGHVKRPTHQNTSWDKAKFEVYGHKWVDLSENGYGVSLLNDCKYGFNTEGSTLKLTMLKCGTFPDPEADQGAHDFTYSLLPHSGDLYAAGVIREAYALNQPLTAVAVSGKAGTLPASFSLVRCDRENVMIETVKKAEADDGMIVRLYDAFNRRTTAAITVPADFQKAVLCDLMENPLEELPLEDGTVRVPVSNFEIVTLKFTR